MLSTTAGAAAPPAPRDETHYHAFLERIQARFAELTNGQPLHTTACAGPELWELYLSAISPEFRQHYTCSACRRFVEQYGNLVVVDAEGAQTSPIWDPALASEELSPSVTLLRDLVEGSPVNGVFLSSEPAWGRPQTGAWRHLAVVPAAALVYQAGVLTAAQKLAELREDFRCLQTALDDFPPEVLEQARLILDAEAVNRSEKFLGAVTWLQQRHQERKQPHPHRRAALLWRAVATAPAGFCKPRSGMIGTLLEDLSAGLPFEDVKQRFDAKMHPLRYQRPQAPPSAGNIRQAEEIFAKLGLAPALERRFATVEDVLEWIWQPRPAAARPDGAGVFGHLTPKGQAGPAAVELPEKTLTWVKFRDTVLPQAERIEFKVPARSSVFCAFVTAVDPTAPPLLQWDREERRNPVSWYFYPQPQEARDWSLQAHAWTPVVGLTRKPSTWNGDGCAHQGDGIMFVLEGARDTVNTCLALFPETLRADLHGVRATIEAHSQSRKLQPVDGQLASGLMFGKGSDQYWREVQIRVTSRGHTAGYRLDRWD